MRGEFIADDREVGESSLGDSFGLDEAELERSFFENNPIVSQYQHDKWGERNAGMGCMKTGRCAYGISFSEGWDVRLL